jgi:predicted ATPase with chaperone activity
MIAEAITVNAQQRVRARARTSSTVVKRTPFVETHTDASDTRMVPSRAHGSEPGR